MVFDGAQRAISEAMHSIYGLFRDVDSALILNESNIAKHADEMTDSEVIRLKSIVAEMNDLTRQFATETDPMRRQEIAYTINKLEEERHKIMYCRPGAIPQALNSVNDAVKRFNTTGQPKVERILDDMDGALKSVNKSVDDFNAKGLPQVESLLGSITYTVTQAREKALPEITRILGDADALLAERQALPRHDAELTEEELAYLNRLRQSIKDTMPKWLAAKAEYDRLKASGASDQKTRDRMAELLRETDGYMRTVDAIDAEISRLLHSSPGVIPDTLYDIDRTIRRFNAVEQPKIEDIMDSVDDTIDEAGEVLRQVRAQFVATTFEPVDPSGLSQELKEKITALQREHDLLAQRLQADRHVPGIAGTPVPLPGFPGRAQRPSPGADNRIRSATGWLADDEAAYLKEVERRKLKIAGDIERIRFRRVDKPGVIPQTLGSLRASLDDAHGLLSKADTAFGRVIGFADRHSTLIKVGLGISGIAVVLTLVLIPVLLIRMLIYGL